MKLYLSISILLFLSATVFSQKIYPIEFDNYQPKWTFISGDLKDTIHTFFTKSPIIFEENVYFVSNVIGVFYNGYQVDQVDKESGIKGWSQSFTTQEHDREFVSNYFINSNREFELLTMKEYNNDYFIWEDASFMNRTFDLSTGDEISNLFFSHSKLPMLLNFGSTINGPNLNRNNHILKGESDFTYVDMFTNGKSYFHISVFDENKMILRDSLFDIGFPGSINLVTSKHVNKKIYYFWDVVKHDFVNTHRMFLKSLDENMNFDVELDLTKKMEQADRYYISFANDSIFMINSFHGREEHGHLNLDSYSIYLFDYFGNVLDEIHVENENDLNFKIGRPLFIKDTKRIVLASATIDDEGYGNVYFLKSNLQQGLDTIKVLRSTSKDIISVDGILQFENGDVLLGLGHLIHFSIDEENGYSIRRIEWSRIDASDLDLNLSVNHDNRYQINVNVYPNPSKGKFRIDCNHQVTFQTVFVYNHLGKLVHTFPYKENMNLGHLPNGVYELVFLDKSHRNIGSKRIIISK